MVKYFCVTPPIRAQGGEGYGRLFLCAIAGRLCRIVQIVDDRLVFVHHGIRVPATPLLIIACASIGLSCFCLRVTKYCRL